MREYRPVSVRRTVYERDGGRCVVLGCKTSLLDLHHVRLVARGGPNTSENLACLCPNHHQLLHRDHVTAGLVRKAVAYNIRLEYARRREARYPVRLELPEAPDFQAALQLYKTYIPARERDSPQEIKRWTRECRIARDAADGLIAERETILRDTTPTATLHPAYATELDHIESIIADAKPYAHDPAAFECFVRTRMQRVDEHIWFDKDDTGRPCGLIYYQYYFAHRLAFVSYVISRVPRRTRSFLDQALLQELRMHHPECEAILGEIDDPASKRAPREQHKAHARLRHFRSQWGVGVLVGAKYVQPRLALQRASTELPLRLVYYPVSGLGYKKELSPEDYERLLSFVLGAVYADAYETQSTREEYARYLDHLMKRLIAQSEYPIRIQ